MATAYISMAIMAIIIIAIMLAIHTSAMANTEIYSYGDLRQLHTSPHPNPTITIMTA
jgi:hypothetical protein